MEHVDVFLRSLEAVGRSPRTIEWYAAILRRFAASGGALTVVAIESYLCDRRRVVSPASVAGEFRTLRRFCNWLVRRGLLEQSPMAVMDAPRIGETVPRVADAAVAVQLAAAAAGGRFAERDRALVLVLADTGARLGELLAMTIDNVRVVVRAGRMTGECVLLGKGGRRRRLLIGRVALDALDGWLAVRPACEGGAVWIGERGPLTQWGVRQILERLSRRAGLPEAVNPHAFRHGAAIDMIVGGSDLRTVQLVLGHSQIGTTVRYLAMADQVISDAHERLSEARWAAVSDQLIHS